MTNLTQLADRMERAECGSRELDEEIFKALHPEYADWVRGRGGLVHPCDGADQRVMSDVRPGNYTSSLDAAMLLAPEGFDWAVFHTNGGLTMHAWCGSREDIFGNTPALALCAAALRARGL